VFEGESMSDIVQEVKSKSVSVNRMGMTLSQYSKH
jgi:hypothetical protein